jgi:hypothetical protein
VPAKKTTAKATARKTPVKKATTSRVSRPTGPAQPGDFIVIDSPQVGSSPREGEVLEVIQGEVSVSYRVKWADGRQTLIAPGSGIARIVRASKRT